jgi:undecaprenyl-diphosphatase
LFALIAIVDELRPVINWDYSVSVWLQGPAELALTVVGAITESLFSGLVVLILTVAGCLFFLWRRQALLAASLATIFPLVCIEVVLKYLLSHPSASRVLQLRKLFATEQTGPTFLLSGFPSGHASRAAFVIGWLAVLLLPQRYRMWGLLAALVLTAFVAWTRIYVGDHSLLEVVAGLLLAAVFLVPAALLRAAANRPPS